ncbi:DUF4393 domain-containing protein [Bacillus sp. FJAT-49705]|uniref:DUF4393 domain-containing protein n=1 Tax=Cytobacillus citreus TaxID=2833586 RepID=A0ABS5NVC2_9BACI|nr:DUF4393 domain-containing protein [Cytobacillus citreus]MBS4191769.1 DUF4393 domain-containing protein [Cytobacillus citreus]
MDPITIGTAIGTTLITNFATKGDSAPIQTLNDLWYLTFGRLQLLVDKKRANHSAQLESYKNELVDAVSAIPDENLIEPPLSIVGPALEASKYYIEEEELRKMFAKIVASSMDDRKASLAHHSFVEIIKQLSPLDAQNIALFKGNYHLPLVNYGVKRDGNNKITTITNVFLSNPECTDIRVIRSSITNLHRLGLVDFRFDILFNDGQKYDVFTHHPVFNNVVSASIKDLNEFPNAEPFIDKGVIEITPFGSDFLSVCL